MDRKTLGYWLATAPFALMLTISGVAHLVRVEPIAESMVGLGYPLYVMTILGVAKLLGVAALVVPGRPLLREWAYAGFTFHLIGATASHLFAGDPLGPTLPPVVLLGLLVASYRLRPDDRRLPLSPIAA